MDYLKNMFKLQLSDATDLLVSNAIESNLRCCEQADGIDRMLTRFNKDYASRSASYAKPWFTALIAAIRPYYVLEAQLESQYEEPPLIIHYYNHAFNDFMEAMIRKLNGNRSLYIGKHQFDTANFTAEELAQPHMQWVPLFVARYNELASRNPELKTVIRMACIHPNKQISDDTLITLYRSYRDEEFDNVMSYSQYVDWYVKSRKHFTEENKTLIPDYQAQMISTLLSWEGSQPRPADDHTDWLCRNYEFHPIHRAFVKQLVIDTLP